MNNVLLHQPVSADNTLLIRPRPRKHRPLKSVELLGIWCFYLVCGVAVPNDEFAVLGGTDQKPGKETDED